MNFWILLIVLVLACIVVVLVIAAAMGLGNKMAERTGIPHEAYSRRYSKDDSHSPPQTKTKGDDSR